MISEMEKNEVNNTLKSDVRFLEDVFESFMKVSPEDYGINPFYCVAIGN